METLKVLNEPLYTQEVLQSFNDITISSDHGEFKASSLMLLSVASQKLKDLLSTSVDCESEPCLILSGYSPRIVQCLDEYSHTGRITLFGKNELNIFENVEDLKSDFECLGVYTPPELWTINKSVFKEEIDVDIYENGESEPLDDHLQNGTIEYHVNTFEEKRSSASDEVLRKLRCENKIGPDGYFVPSSIYKFDKDDPKSSRYVCPICETATFFLCPDLHTHMSDFHKECASLVPETFECPRCSRKFTSARWWFIHTSKSQCPPRSHPVNPTELPPNSVFEDPNKFVSLREGSRNGFNYTCLLCNTVFNKGYNEWVRHINVYHKEHVGCLGQRYQCQVCSKMFSAGNYMKHTKGGYCQGTAQCKICGKHFGKRKYLFDHLNSFHVEESASCEKCGAVVKNKQQLKLHMLRSHGKLVTCDQCGKVFKSRASLMAHIRTIHTEEKDMPYHCSICGKGFGRKPHLMIHERNHRNEKPYKCRFCDYASSSVGNRRIHEKNVHKDLLNMEKYN